MRQYVAARERGDRDAMYRHWSELLPDVWEHVEKQIRLSGHKLWSDAERDDALSEAATRLAANVVWNFAGTTTNELIGCVKAVARIAVLDVQRDAAGHHEKHTYLEAPVTGDEGTIGTQAEAVYAKDALEKAEDERAEEAMLEAMAQRRAFLTWALPQLSERRRKVIELLLEGRTPVEIMDKLEITRANVDQTKKRAMQDLIKLLKQYRKEEDES